VRHIVLITGQRLRIPEGWDRFSFKGRVYLASPNDRDSTDRGGGRWAPRRLAHASQRRGVSPPPHPAGKGQG
jgi:hypothetical protein